MQSQQLTDATTRHAVYLERLKTGQVRKFAHFLQEMESALVSRLATEDELTDFSRTRLNALLRDTRAELNGILSRMREQLSDDLRELAGYEAGVEARHLDGVGFEAVMPAPELVASAAFSRPLSVRGADGGKLLAGFIEDWSKSDVRRVEGLIRQGAYEGRTNHQIAQSIRGTAAANYRDGDMARVRRNATAIVRTSIQHVASVARMETWKSNSNVVTGYRWVSTLDSRTSTTCQALDGRVFEFGKGPLPPAHIQCRSTTVAELDGRFAALRQGATRRAGKDTVSANETYYSWLKKQPASFQDEVLGKTRGKLFRDGGMSESRFRQLQLDRNFRPLTLDEMRNIEPVPFHVALEEGLDLTKNPESAKSVRIIGDFLEWAKPKSSARHAKRTLVIGRYERDLAAFAIPSRNRVIALDRGSVKHIHKRHGVGNESLPGQLPIDSSDLSRLPRILDEAANVRPGNPSRSHNGAHRLHFVAEVGGFDYEVLIEVRRWQLVPVTMWKRKAKK